MHIHIINGPNLNLLGSREPDIYGSSSFTDYLITLQQLYPTHTISYYQSNIEGEIINELQTCKANAIVINPAAYSHTSIGIADAIAAITPPCIEVHISNIYARESYRHISLTAAKCKGVLSGFGLHGYALAIQYLINNL
jgi:3-dehydroquinate dehydratase II